jgi:mannobiose 2-epimerase
MTTEPDVMRDCFESLAAEYVPQLEETLHETIIDFWFPRSIDELHGGFLTSYGSDDRHTGSNDLVCCSAGA